MPSAGKIAEPHSSQIRENRPKSSRPAGSQAVQLSQTYGNTR